jgi:hypothetical protein
MLVRTKPCGDIIYVKDEAGLVAMPMARHVMIKMLFICVMMVSCFTGYCISFYELWV